ncbi:HAMP domain-containing histidine kinase [Bradyrhizobium sp. U87765 SZCCT0131]|uniref:sensor histidine kinase n=1 Tax=unclassified Bradyrhizobium TaxID=2631580 RepID=UPI001BA822EB|nr:MULTISPECIES: HAMP domain-containing sensor histidine kinase [unclassified Bradyrhizobium]MBR1223145.1 HAMP domain-containing histidine kinase [Bradyrhizobium sp. U87765 SZCCT0131]MBR1265723.1 HAMP domain-containing histidine kinase [Bradyrhizobium sp. U87765 SZCCT0134]MBR1309306.1 HAMP domain-containing histidine kinase [Bradyrhizobium sp. U87765 SZCCT0110]MBR1324134.1 HAMP domain-containing histidine kinase [Bradyrhizobium sp. U87765 SZCCT0109]MBR1352567.1 HAMP domain-containing histidine
MSSASNRDPASRKASLKRLLFWRLLAVQSVVLIAVIAVLFASGHLFDFNSTDSTIETLRGAVVREPGGGWRLAETDGLRALRRDRDFWFTARDRDGRQVTEGQVPPEYDGVGAALDRVGQARLGWNIGDPDRPVARMRWAHTAAGRLQFVTGTSSATSPYLMLLGVSLILIKLVLPILAVMALGALVATPLVVRRSLAGVERAACEAHAIDSARRGSRLTATDVPAEVAPLVLAVNGALGRLDEGYERQERFLVDAAHELRTPIAILNARIAALPHSGIRDHLMEDTTRLVVLTEQMLDVQRLHQGARAFVAIDLVALSRRVALDMGPLAFAAGYEVRFEAQCAAAFVRGDAMALERALTNLVQNAIDHGGRRGTITLTVGPGFAEVGDEGPGIPVELRAHIFAPFFKQRANGRGAGLGLNLVSDVMRMHDGDVVLVERAIGIAFRLMLPAVPASAGV